MNGSGPARAPPKENSPYSRSLCIFFCLVRLVKRDVLNTRKRPATGVPALPGFSYFASISTSTAPTYITYTHAHTRVYPGKVEHSRGIHGSADDHHVEYVWIAKIIDNFNRLPKDRACLRIVRESGIICDKFSFFLPRIKAVERRERRGGVNARDSVAVTIRQRRHNV